MDSEHLSDIELIRSGAIKGREALEILDDGHFVFHGSDEDLNALEPRQAYNWKSGEKVPDGEPAVFAADSIDVAIFMAIRKGLQGKSGFSKKEDETGYTFCMSKELASNLEKLPDKTGYVMVMPKDSFEKIGGEYRSEIEVKPEFVVKVSKKDLPAKIDIPEDY